MVQAKICSLLGDLYEPKGLALPKRSGSGLPMGVGHVPARMRVAGISLEGCFAHTRTHAEILVNTWDTSL